MEEENKSHEIVEIGPTSVPRMSAQRGELRKFIKDCLQTDVDFGIIPGTPKPSLYKPGAEKIGTLFGLGSRIISVDKEMNLKDSFVMFTYRMEIFHIKSGSSVAQCEGSANSFEKKYRSKPIGDLINTLQKMAQKRAFVGAMITATGASDFFTQDMEDLPPEVRGTPSGPAPRAAESNNPGDFICDFGKFRGIRVCDINTEELTGYVDYIKRKASEDKKPIQGQVKAFIDHAEAYLKG